MAFVGRSAELEELDSVFAEAVRGRGGFVLLSGEPGIGKSSLCAAFAEQALRRAARVAWGRAWEWGGAPPFWPFVQVLRALDGGEGELDPLARMSSEQALISESSESARFAFFDLVTERLRGAARSDPLLLVLEDLHAADVPSLLLLRFAVEHLREARVLVLGTFRSVEASPGPEVVTLLGELSRLSRAIGLSGLSQQEVAELMSADDESGERELAAALHDRTGGNPLLIGALLHSGAAGESGAAVPLQARAAVERRLSRLEPSAREILSVASVIGREMAVLLLAKICDRPLEDVLEGVRVLSAEQILVERPGAPGRYGFCHGLFREVVYAALPPAERLRLHRAAGFALEALYGADRHEHLSELARHFLAVAPDPSRGVDYAQGAGDHAMRSLGYEDAVTHYGHALAAAEVAPLEPARLATLSLKLGDAQSAAGAVGAARESYRRARSVAIDAGQPAVAAQATVAFARSSGFARADEEGTQWLERALADAQEPTVRVRLLSALIDRIWMRPRAADRVRELAREAIALARATGDPRLQVEALASGLRMAWRPSPEWQEECRAQATALVELADASGDPGLRLEACRWQFTMHMLEGAVPAARAALDTYERLGERFSRAQIRFNALLRRSMLAILEGRFDELRELLVRAEHAGARAGDLQAPLLILAQRYQLCRAFDDRPGIVRSLERLEATSDQALSNVDSMALRAVMHAQLGLREQARGELEAYFEIASRLAWYGSHIGLSSATWAAFYLGHTQAAAQLVPVLEPYEGLCMIGGAIEFHGPGSLLLGLAHCTAGRHAEAERKLQNAIHRLEAMGARYLAAQAKHALAYVLGVHEPERAAALRRAASQAAREMGGVVLAVPLSEALNEAGHEVKPAGAAQARDGVPEPAPQRPTPGVFAREGDLYAIGLSGAIVRVRHAKGLAFIERLLRNEGTDVHVLALSDSALDERDSGPALLDAQAKAAYRARVADLRAELEEAQQFADAGRAERASAELEALLAELSRATGLSGRDRPTGLSERARARVTLAIRRAIKAIEQVDPVIAAHLDVALVTGTFCAYRPDPRARIAWRFERSAQDVDS